VGVGGAQVANDLLRLPWLVDGGKVRQGANGGCGTDKRKRHLPQLEELAWLHEEGILLEANGAIRKLSLLCRQSAGIRGKTVHSTRAPRDKSKAIRRHTPRRASRHNTVQCKQHTSTANVKHQTARSVQHLGTSHSGRKGLCSLCAQQMRQSGHEDGAYGLCSAVDEVSASLVLAPRQVAARHDSLVEYVEFQTRRDVEIMLHLRRRK
jgi:hypothetical protein